MLKTSEWVSCGHPDKTADYISSYILDRFIERDPLTRYALEVQIKDNHVTLGGEITSRASIAPEGIAAFVRNAVKEVGYTKEYQQRFGAENCICGDDIIVAQHISQQSPDIAQGVDASGWGDQGIFWGMAVNSPETEYMPQDWWLARKIGKYLYDIRYAGIDIKTQVTMRDGKPDEIVVAIPMTERQSERDIASAVNFCCGGITGYQLYVNGTGRYVRHGSIGDCGTTGRKLAVDFYGGNCRLGGGSPWTKDGTKADLTLNLYARELAKEYLTAHPEKTEIHCAISCRIGSPKIRYFIFDEKMNEMYTAIATADPAALIARYRLREPRFAKMCREGLFA